MQVPIILSGDTVVRVDTKKKLGFINGSMVTFQTIQDSIGSFIVAHFPDYHIWFRGGIRAEILQPGKEWKKGILKLVVTYHVEFLPDKPEVPLDDLRSQLDDLQSQIDTE
ncbi:KGK domain-containing protein [Nostoc sp. NOS(2021)]|uniref:KGK domain-containing protein n=1 Tax=Nostoc sp. NOS(2021) TaxID=2815407 RepID=UPI0025E7C3B6|nr:KGK domain-containing protein [Nostoc sp. NOS(2021)]